jgi:putative endonuclease
MSRSQSLDLMLRLFLYMKFYTYILYSSALDSFYIGYTSMEIDERIKKHNTNHTKGLLEEQRIGCVFFQKLNSKKYRKNNT